MANSLTVDINGIGQILLERSARAKRIAISIRPQKGVRVAVPTRTSFNKALGFIYLKRQWIQRNITKMEYYENQRKSMMHSFLNIDKTKATTRLISSFYQLANKHRFTYNKVTIRNQKTRWGSCSHKNNISLNMKAVMLPKELIDYVILHELVHTRIHNHSGKFWAELDNYIGNSKAIASRLRKYGLGSS